MGPETSRLEQEAIDFVAQRVPDFDISQVTVYGSGERFTIFQPDGRGAVIVTKACNPLSHAPVIIVDQIDICLAPVEQGGTLVYFDNGTSGRYDDQRTIFFKPGETTPIKGNLSALAWE